MVCKSRFFFFFHRQGFNCWRSGTTWGSLFQLEGTVRQGFMVTTLSQDLCAKAWSESASLSSMSATWPPCAPGPLRKPSLVQSVPGCCKSESVSTDCIALFQSPAIYRPPSLVLCGAMCSALALLVTALEQCLPYTHTHSHIMQPIPVLI